MGTDSMNSRILLPSIHAQGNPLSWVTLASRSVPWVSVINQTHALSGVYNPSPAFLLTS